jgi:predicted Zn-dependent protease with MMP-like domain
VSEPDREGFEAIVADAIDALPAWVLDSLDNVEVIVEDEPPEGEGRQTLGLYSGIPQTKRGIGYGGVTPDRIQLFAGPIGRHARATGDRLADVVARTLRHELAHHFGIDDERLDELDAY